MKEKTVNLNSFQVVIEILYLDDYENYIKIYENNKVKGAWKFINI